MPLSIPFTDPTDTTVLPDTYVYCTSFAFDFQNKTGRIVYTIYRSLDACDAGRRPVGEIAYNVTPTGVPATYGLPPVLDPGTPEVPPVVDPITGQVITPGVPGTPPTYGPPPLLRPAFPSFGELVTANEAAYAALAQAVYALALSQPEFAGAKII